MSQHKFAIYLGNLRPDVRARYHKHNLLQLFTAMQINIDKHAIELHYDGKDEPAYAYIDLDNERDQRYAIQTLSDLGPEGTATEEFENFDYEALVIEGEELRIAAKNDKILKKYGRHKKNKMKTNVVGEDVAPEREETRCQPPHTNIKKRSKGVYRYVQRGDPMKSPRNNESPVEEETTTELIQSLRPEKTYQEEWLERLQSGTAELSMTSQNGDGELKLPDPDNRNYEGSLSDASEVGSEQDLGSEPVSPERFYIRGQHVDNGGGPVEFLMKSGKLPKKEIKKVVGKYVVSFLNTSGGKLMLGVDDEGVVCGREFTRKDENVMRLVIDDVIRGIQPLVIPRLYHLEFVPVQVKGNFGNVKIVEIMVEPGVSDRLYMTKNGDIFVRRHGNVQGPLKPSEVEEWNQGGCSDRLPQTEGELEELHAHQTALRDDEHKHKHGGLELMELLRAKKNSTVCGIL